MREFFLFNRHLFKMLHFVRGPFVALLLILLTFALITAEADDIALADAVYFIFITALTVGYGDITPSSEIARAISVLSGIIGVIFVGLLVAVSVRALEHAVEEKRQLQQDKLKSDDKP